MTMKYLSSMVDSLFGIGKWSSRVLMITTLYLANSVMMNTLSDKLPEAVMAAAPYISVACTKT